MIKNTENALDDIIERRSKGETLQSIANDYGVTRERIRQIAGSDASASARTLRKERREQSLERLRVDREEARIKALLAPYEEKSKRWSDEDILACLREAAATVGADTISIKKYNGLVPLMDIPSSATVTLRFNSWNDALEAAGLKAANSSRVQPFYKREDAVASVKAYLAEKWESGSLSMGSQKYDEWRLSQKPTTHPIPSAALIVRRWGWANVRAEAASQMLAER